MIQEIDWQVSGLMEALDEFGLSENTLVIFASDNGPQLNMEGHGSSGSLRDGKWTNFEGGLRSPTIMRWPAVIRAGASNDEFLLVPSPFLLLDFRLFGHHRWLRDPECHYCPAIP